MRTNSPTRWRVLAVGVAVFAALALTACSSEQGNETTTDSATISDSASLTITEATDPSSPADSATIRESADVNVTDGDGPGSATTDAATITESAVKAVESAPSGGGGSGDRTFIQDSVSFVVRDSDGVVKDQGILN